MYFFIAIFFLAFVAYFLQNRRMPKFKKEEFYTNPNDGYSVYSTEIKGFKKEAQATVILPITAELIYSIQVVTLGRQQNNQIIQRLKDGYLDLEILSNSDRLEDLKVYVIYKIGNSTKIRITQNVGLVSNTNTSSTTTTSTTTPSTTSTTTSTTTPSTTTTTTTSTSTTTTTSTTTPAIITYYYNGNTSYNTPEEWYNDPDHTIPADTIPTSADNVVISKLPVGFSPSISCLNATFNLETPGNNFTQIISLVAQGTVTFNCASNSAPISLIIESLTAYNVIINGTCEFTAGSSGPGITWTIANNLELNTTRTTPIVETLTFTKGLTGGFNLHCKDIISVGTTNNTTFIGVSLNPIDINTTNIINITGTGANYTFINDSILNEVDLRLIEGNFSIVGLTDAQSNSSLTVETNAILGFDDSTIQTLTVNGEIVFDGTTYFNVFNLSGSITSVGGSTISTTGSDAYININSGGDFSIPNSTFNIDTGTIMDITCGQVMFNVVSSVSTINFSGSTVFLGGSIDGADGTTLINFYDTTTYTCETSFLGNFIVSYNSAIPAPIPGCTDYMASNYNPEATCDDGNCIY